MFCLNSAFRYTINEREEMGVTVPGEYKEIFPML
jgi:hypothetical protein